MATDNNTLSARAYRRAGFSGDWDVDAGWFALYLIQLLIQPKNDGGLSSVVAVPLCCSLSSSMDDGLQDWRGGHYSVEKIDIIDGSL